MRKLIVTIALGAAVIAAPALAQMPGVFGIDTNGVLRGHSSLAFRPMEKAHNKRSLLLLFSRLLFINWITPITC